MSEKNPHAVELGRKGGQSRSPAKLAALAISRGKRKLSDHPGAVYQRQRRLKKALEAFASTHNLRLCITKHDWGWMTCFEFSEIKEGIMLVGQYGRGDSPSASVEDYAKAISGKLLVINAYTQNRKEIRVPQFQADRSGPR